MSGACAAACAAMACATANMNAHHSSGETYDWSGAHSSGGHPILWGFVISFGILAAIVLWSVAITGGR